MKNNNLQHIKFSIRFVEKSHRHFDRSDAKHREAEKSTQNQVSRLAYGSLEMTFLTLFYRAFSINNSSFAELTLDFISHCTNHNR